MDRADARVYGTCSTGVLWTVDEVYRRIVFGVSIAMGR
jgi:hypothetical protein